MYWLRTYCVPGPVPGAGGVVAGPQELRFPRAAEALSVLT